MQIIKNIYRNMTCSEPHAIGSEVIISGWINKKRDHGDLIFIDLRDSYGVVQCVAEQKSKQFVIIQSLKLESVITVTGKVIARDAETINNNITTGKIEVVVEDIVVHSSAHVLPFQISDDDLNEDMRLKYRYLDMRRSKTREIIKFRSEFISFVRNRMEKENFMEVQTPILTASSPEGARDFLVPSRLHPGKFYALPQAPQQFKQLLMIGGFERYFQIAPCFRDEDARADRSPGEFYQLDCEMSFVTQQDVIDTFEPIIYDIFKHFANDFMVNQYPFPVLTYDYVMEVYGTDKPDLRNPLIIQSVSNIFTGSSFKLFSQRIEKGDVVYAIRAPLGSQKPRAWFDQLNSFAQSHGAGGLGYIQFDDTGKAIGPIANNLNENDINSIKQVCKINNNDSVFFVCAPINKARTISSKVRDKLCLDLNLLEENIFKFCWVIDYPMYELDSGNNKVIFSHNPFSMPKGGMDALHNQDPLTIRAQQYDIVCNGIELSSGAIRNNNYDSLLKAFAIAGFSEEQLHDKFPSMIEAFKFGVPPHGGFAPGIERMLMLLANTNNIREVIPFPLNGNGEDLMMKAPNTVTQQQLQDLSIKINIIKNESKQKD